MESEPPITGVNRATGIPRLSKLPVLTSRPSQILSLPKQDEILEPAKQTHASFKLKNRASSGSLSRPSQSTTKSSIATTKPLPSRGRPPNGVYYGSKASTSTVAPRASIVRPSSRGNQQRLPRSAPKASTNPEDEENEDQLSSLGSFRAASRLDSHDDSSTEPVECAEPADLPEVNKENRASRPSLSDRAIESLNNLPATPKERRQSDFFSPVESPMAPPPRPTSSRNGSSNNSSRPGTSDGTFARAMIRPPAVVKKAPSSAKPASRTSLGGFGFTPGITNGRSVSSTFTSKLQTKVPFPTSPSPSKQAALASSSNGLRAPKATTASKTVAGRRPKPRSSLADTFGPTTQHGVAQQDSAEERAIPAQVENAKTSETTVSNPTNASSVALREQIAAAKATARKEKPKHDSLQDISVLNDRAFEMEMSTNPFNQGPKDGKHILRNRVHNARMDGKLNIAAMGLKHIPEEVLQMYDAKVLEESNVNWAEIVDVTRLIAADNEIEELGEAVFPDRSAEDFNAEDQTEGNQFGGLELLDLHGNTLQSLPMGLRRLERLTTLNLSHNRLDNDAMDVISQITTLRDLRVGHNALSGNMTASICNLQHLEKLDLQSNRLLGLPEALRELLSLKVLDVSGNQLTALPMDALQVLPLTELDASSNALISSLFPPGGKSAHPTLRTLKVSNNSIAALTFSETLDLPQLRTLDVMNNHLTALPPVFGWAELVTLTAGDNKIAELPPGFTTLRKLRNVNFASNELRLLDPEIARMESLDSLVVAANPLREKKFLTMSAANIKQDLKSRLDPVERSTDQETSHDARDHLSPLGSSPSCGWSLKANGVLDLSRRGYSDDINDSLGSFFKINEVKQLHLNANLLTALPPALWLGHDLRILNLSENALGSDYLSDELELPSLEELVLNRCRLITLEPLMTQLQAPKLQTLNITANRLSGPLPTLRESYPALTTLFASENRFTSVTADSLRDLHTVNLASNDIEQLPAEIGLLWAEGLKSLEIGANAFRVPNHSLLQKGTEATLRWLRDKLPVVQSAALVNGDEELD